MGIGKSGFGVAQNNESSSALRAKIRAVIAAST